MYYNDDFRSSDQYRYTNRDQLPHDDYAPAPTAHRRLRRSLPRSGDSSTALP